MITLPKKSLAVSKWHPTASNINEFNQIGIILVWLAVFLSTCLAIMNRITRGNCLSTIRPSHYGKRTNIHKHGVISIETRTRSRITANKQANMNIGARAFTLESLGDVCVNGSRPQVQKVFKNCKYLMVLVILATITLFQPNLIQLANANPQVTLVGSGSDTLTPSDYSKTGASVTEILNQLVHIDSNIFFLVSLPASETFNFSINFSLTEQEYDDFLKVKTVNRTFDLSTANHNSDSQNTYFQVVVDMENDLIHEVDGLITFTLLEGDDYSLDSNIANRSMTVTLIDNDNGSKPKVIFLGVGSSENFMESSFSRTHTLTESNTRTTSVYFLMYIPNDAGTNFFITYELDQGQNDFLIPNQSTSINVATASKSTSGGKQYIRGSFEVVNDTTHEADGSITFTLLDGERAYAISSVTAQNTATTTVTDNDTPQISISRIGKGPTMDNFNFDEADTISYTLTANPQPYTTITVEVTINEPNNSFISGTPTTSFNITTADSGIKTGEIILSDDGIDEANSAITIQITSCTGCEVVSNSTANDPNNPTNTISISVSDNDTPDISITGPVSVNDADSVNPPITTNTATFTLEADPIPYDEISIKINIIQTPIPNTNAENLFDGANTRTVMMDETDTKTGDTTRGSVSFTINLRDLGGGSITLAVVLNTDDPNKYELPDFGSSVTTRINDLATAPTGPVIELVAVSTTSITEGADAVFNFQVKTGDTVTTTLEVDLSVTQVGSFFAGTPNNTISISATNTTASLPIETVDDEIDEANGSIIVTIIQGKQTPPNKNYQISDTEAKLIQTITVNDNDTPVVSISQTGTTSIIEGSVASISYTLAAAPRPFQDLMVNVTISQTGNVISGTTSMLIREMKTVSTSGTGVGQVIIHDDSVNEANSTIAIQVTNGVGYRPVSTNTPNVTPSSTLEIAVTDDDVPQVKISHSNATVTEANSSITYTLTANPVPYQRINIALNITESGAVIFETPFSIIPMTISGTASGTIHLDDDRIDEVDSTIRIQISRGTGYSPVSSSMPNADPSNTIMIVVSDDDEPIISVTSASSVNENDELIFTLTSDIVPLQNIQIVILLTSEPFAPGVFLVADEGKTGDEEHKRLIAVLMTPADKKTKNFTVEMCNRANAHLISCRENPGAIPNPAGGFITATVESNPGQAYQPDMEKNSHRIQVIDADSSPDGPLVELQPVTSTSIVEGGTANFNFQAVIPSGSTVLDSALELDLRIAQTGNFIDGTQTNTVNISTSGSGSKSISTLDDNIDEANGSITVEILIGRSGGPANKNYRLSDDKTKVSQTVMVQDNEDPIVSISSTTETAAENDSRIIYWLTASPVPYEEITIVVNVTESGAIIAGTPTTILKMPVSGTARGIVNLDNDNMDEADSTITIQVANGNGYAPASTSTPNAATSNTITILVSDNDVPKISITSDAIVSENDDAIFTLTADIFPWENISISVNITQTPYTDGQLLYVGAGNSGNQSRTVEMQITDTPRGSKTLMLDLNDLGGGSITVEVATHPDGKYQPGANASFSTIVIDEDSVPTGPVIELAEVTSTTIEEGRSAIFSFRVAAGDIVTSVLEINLKISQTGDYISGKPTNTVEIGSTGTGSILIQTINDEINEVNGSITVEILRGQLNPPNKNYRLSEDSAKVSQTIMVLDNDAPKISITRTVETVSERDTISYTLTANPVPHENITISLNITETGNVIAGTPVTSITMSTSGFATGIIMLVDDDEDEYDSIITIQVVSAVNSGYEPVVESTPNAIPSNTISILVKDDEELDLKISIDEESTGPIIEGNSAEFVLTSSQEIPNGGLTININVYHEGSFIAWRVPRSFHMVNEREILRFQTVKRPGQNEEGAISVTVLAVPNSYSVDESNYSAGFRIINENPITTPDDESRISVASLAVTSILDILNTPPATSPSDVDAESALTIVRPLVSIAAIESQVDEGSSARFLIMSRNGAESTNISVSFQVQQSLVEIEHPSKKVVNIAGQEAVSITIPTINNDHADDDGYVAISLLEDPSYLIAENAGRAVVNISDAIDRQQRLNTITAHAQAFIPDLIGQLGANSLATISNRIDLGFSESSNQVLEFGGQHSISGMLTASGEAFNENSTTFKSFLGDSSFAMSLISGNEFAIPTTLWGIGDYQNLSSTGHSESIDWTGDLFTGHIGIDALIQEGLLTGISASVSESEVEFETTDPYAIAFDSRTTSINPYIGWTSNDRNLELHATIGLGRGELEVKQKTYDNEILDSESFSFGLTGNQLLFTSDSIFDGITSLSFKGNSWFAHQFISGRDGILADFHTNSHHIHIRIDGTHQIDFTAGSTLSPIVSIGVRSDAKVHQSELGVELTSGADYSNPIGVTITGKGSVLIGSESQVQRIKLDSTLTYDHGSNQHGFFAEAASFWVQSDANIQESLWNSNALDSSYESNQYSNGTSLSSEFGYGLEILSGEGILTPISGFEVSNNQGREFLIGTRLGLGSNANFELSGIQGKNTSGINSTRVRFKGSLTW